MTEVEKKEYYSSLYDLYSSLLTDKQRSYFEDYYFNDLSLFEIADNNNVSRNAIHDQLQKVRNILDDYESKLGLLKKEKESYPLELNVEKADEKKEKSKM